MGECFVRGCDWWWSKVLSPFNSFFALLIIDDGGSRKVIKESTCPHCNRRFCGRGARFFGKFRKKLNVNETDHDDINLMKLAEKNTWKRCPNCRYNVEKLYGCDVILCRSVFMVLISLDLYFLSCWFLFWKWGLKKSLMAEDFRYLVLFSLIYQQWKWFWGFSD